MLPSRLHEGGTRKKKSTHKNTPPRHYLCLKMQEYPFYAHRIAQKEIKRLRFLVKLGLNAAKSSFLHLKRKQVWWGDVLVAALLPPTPSNTSCTKHFEPSDSRHEELKGTQCYTVRCELIYSLRLGCYCATITRKHREREEKNKQTTTGWITGTPSAALTHSAGVDLGWLFRVH